MSHPPGDCVMNLLLILLSLLVPAMVLVGLRHVSNHRVLTLSRFGHFRRTLGPGWHWVIPGIERLGPEVGLIGHHLYVPATASGGEVELYYQILEPEKAGEQLNEIDAWVIAQTRDVLRQASACGEQVKAELNRRIGRLGLRVIRCSLHLG